MAQMISIAVALIPLALYFFVLTALNRGCRPRMMTGQEDLTMLAAGLIGFVMVGPMLYVLPIDALAVWKYYTWFLLALLYLLIAWFCGALFRFRVVIYNIDAKELREILEKIGQEIDPEACWQATRCHCRRLAFNFIWNNGR